MIKAQSVESLNTNFAIKNHIEFVEGGAGFPEAKVTNYHGETRISFKGAHILSYKQRDGEDVLFLSKDSKFDGEDFIHGGIPICWPWFAEDKNFQDIHGFARYKTWRLVSTDVVTDGATELRFQLHDDKHSRKIWPHHFELEYVVTAGDVLKLELIVRNLDTKPFSFTGSLHTYFKVFALVSSEIDGLQGVSYLDKVEDFKRKHQAGHIRFESEVDRIYEPDEDLDVTLTDSTLDRKIKISSKGNHSIIVWNPGEEVARKLENYLDKDYMEMVCVETGSVAGNEITLHPDGEHSSKTTISVEPLYT